jgi:glycosyl transferase family 87
MVRPSALTRDGILAASRGLLIAAIVIVGSGWVLFNLPTEQHHWLYDFRGGLYNAGVAILAGHNPFQAGYIAHQAAIMRAGGIAVGETWGHPFSLPVYPAPANLAVVPLSLLPFWLAATLFTGLSVAAMALALRLLGVRDWRCYVLALASWPFVYGLELGTLGPLLVLGVAALWRWRDRLWPPAMALAAVVIAKIFPFPLAAWLIITRRHRQLALTAGLGAAVTLGAWAVLGFAGLTSYPTMLSNLSFIQEGRSDSLVAVLLAAGFSARAAQALALLAAAGLLGLAWRFARAGGHQPQAFGLAVMAALTASPIVWDHYLVLLFVPIALLSPSYSQLWLVPLAGPILLALSTAVVPLGHVSPSHAPHNTRMALISLGLEAFVVLRLCRSRSSVASKRLVDAAPTTSAPPLATAH